MGLGELAELGVETERLKQWLTYFVTDFYDEFHEAIRGQEEEFRWQALETYNLPLIIYMSARGLMELLSSL